MNEITTPKIEPETNKPVVPKEKPTKGEPAEQRFIRSVVYYLVIILFVGFATTFVAAATMLVDSWRTKTASYEDLSNQIQEQNSKIDALINEIHQ